MYNIAILSKWKNPQVSGQVAKSQLGIEPEGGKMGPKDIPYPSFDKNSRRIPPKGLQARVCDPNRAFYLKHPQLDEAAYRSFRAESVDAYKDILPQKHLKKLSKITGEEIKEKVERLVSLIENNSQIANLVKGTGVWLPTILPPLVKKDLGREVDMYLEAVAKSYTKVFSDRRFFNHCGILENKLSIAEGSNHEQLIERMKEGPVIGIRFPNPLQGYSVDADREQMATLSGTGLILSGIDTLAAMVTHTRTLARGWYTPGLDLAALGFAGSSLGFKAFNDGLCFGSTDYLACVDGRDSGGLLFLG